MAARATRSERVTSAAAISARRSDAAKPRRAVLPRSSRASITTHAPPPEKRGEAGAGAAPSSHALISSHAGRSTCAGKSTDRLVGTHASTATATGGAASSSLHQTP